MGLIKDRHGTYYAQQKVPERLQEAVAEVLNNGKPRQAYLKKSLGTKDLKTANVRAKPVQMDFDRIMRAAAALKDTKPPTRDILSSVEIERMAEYVYARTLAWDERFRFGGRDELKRAAEKLRKELRNEGRELDAPAYRYEDLNNDARKTIDPSAAGLKKNPMLIGEMLSVAWAGGKRPVVLADLVARLKVFGEQQDTSS
jgi:hypothetical protein